MRGSARAALLALVVILGTPAVAHAAPAAAPTIITSLDPDGEPCTGVPNSVPGVFNFTAQCAQHDACYVAGGDRLACDTTFRQAMVSACTAQHPDLADPRRYLCLTFAELYFLGVRLFGGFFFPTG